MDRSDALKTFIAVAEERGFTRAATELGVSKSVASRQISALESAVGGQLFKRSTRHVELTAAGQAYLARAKAILADLDAADRAVVAPRSELSGGLRIAAPVAFGTRRLGPIAARFMVHFPNVTLEIALADRIIDPAEEGFDLALRIVSAGIDPLPAVALAPIELGLFASPDYLAKHGRPQAPSDLSRHAGLVLGEQAPRVGWNLRGLAAPVSVTPRLASNTADVVREAALAGLGIALLPLFTVAEIVKDGRLVRILDGFEPKPALLCAAYPQDRIPPPRVSRFVDFLVERLRDD